MLKFTSKSFFKTSAQFFGSLSKNGATLTQLPSQNFLTFSKLNNFSHFRDFNGYKNLNSAVTRPFSTTNQAAGQATATMEPCSLKNKHCIPCRGGVPPLTEKEIRDRSYLKELDEQWNLAGSKNKDENSTLRLKKGYNFTDIDLSKKFINGLTVVAEAEGHHPDITLQGNEVNLEIFTHKIQGLTESDFVFAAKANEVFTNLSYKVDIEKDHPAYTDQEYIDRRMKIAEYARSYKRFTKVKDIDYIEREHEIWRMINKELTKAQNEFAWSPYLKALKYLNLSLDRIPQLEEINAKLQKLTGFRLEPVQGLIPARQFIGSHVDNVFPAAQFIRHWKQPFYTPEPDIIHEIAHAQSLGIPQIAELSRLMGQLALRVSDECMRRVARMYWFTLEFGCVMEEGKLKTYGAGMLSSYGEMNQIRNNPQITYHGMDFENMINRRVGMEEVTNYQKHLYVAESAQDLYDKLKDYIINFEDKWYEVMDVRQEVIYDFVMGRTFEELKSQDYKNQILKNKKHIQILDQTINDVIDKNAQQLVFIKKLMREVNVPKNISGADRVFSYQFKNFLITKENFVDKLIECMATIGVKPKITFTWGKAEVCLKHKQN